MKPQGTKPVRLFTDRYVENLENIFKRLFKEEILTDVTIHCKDGSVKAHKVVLASSSAYFRDVFTEHPEPHVAYIMHGVSYGLMSNLMELIYRGSTEIANESMSCFYDLVEDLGVKGVVYDEKSASGYGRDTRFKGLKRVAVDYKEEDESNRPAKVTVVGEKSMRKSTENGHGENAISSPESDAASINDALSHQQTLDCMKRTAWALKQRKYKCELCPSSFKRASHLTRHQLVHTGERPYPCSLCDKAFSRPDKLKHHVRKAHDSYSDGLASDSLYTIGHVEILSTSRDNSEEPPTRVTREDLEPRLVLAKPIEPIGDPQTDTKVTFTIPQKKGRGRPRKYPPTPKPLVKRPRGRPRINPLASQSGGQTTAPSIQTTTKKENYDITNMPYGDLEYLTKPILPSDNNEDSSNQMESALMEPLVEIKMETDQERPENTELSCATASSFLGNIGLLETSAIAKIGECTISVTTTNS